jgi:hypothetical protein
VMRIDENGKSLGIATSPAQLTSAETPERFDHLIRLTLCDLIYGVGRANILRKTKLICKFSSSDRVLLGHLGLLGRFRIIQEPLFLRRMHSKSSVRCFPQPQLRTVWFDPLADSQWVFPHWRAFVEYLQAIHRSSLTWRESLLCYVAMVAWVRRNRRRLTNDLQYALFPAKAG